jgi:hypothetical protein
VVSRNCFPCLLVRVTDMSSTACDSGSGRGAAGHAIEQFSSTCFFLDDAAMQRAPMAVL